MAALSSPVKIIEKSIKIFFEKKNLIYFLKIYSVSLPLLLISFIQGNVIGKQIQSLGPDNVGQFLIKFPWPFGSMVVISLLNLFLTFWVMVAGIKAIGGVLSGEYMPIGGLFRFAWKKLFVFSLLEIVTGLLIGLGMILLIVPGIIFAVWFCFAHFIIVSSNSGVRQSLSKSKELVKGRFFPIFGRLLVFGIFSALCGFLLSGIPFLGEVARVLAGALFILPAYILYKEVKG